jgi:tetratricopeptide (TPR) repeat protein
VGSPEQAITEAEAVIDKNRLLTRRAQAIKLLAYRQRGDLDTIPTIQAEIENNRPHDRKYAEAVDSMTTTEISLRHSRLAEVYAEQLLEPNNPQYQIPLAWMNMRRGDFETALALIDPSSEQQPIPVDSPDFACYLALKVICHANLGNWEKADEQAIMLESLQPMSCTGAWSGQARRTRLMIAEATKVFRQKQMLLGDAAKAQK